MDPDSDDPFGAPPVHGGGELDGVESESSRNGFSEHESDDTVSAVAAPSGPSTRTNGGGVGGLGDIFGASSNGGGTMSSRRPLGHNTFPNGHGLPPHTHTSQSRHQQQQPQQQRASSQVQGGTGLGPFVPTSLGGVGAFGSLQKHSTPQDRQRAVAKLLARSHSFSEKREEEEATFEVDMNDPSFQSPTHQSSTSIASFSAASPNSSSSSSSSTIAAVAPASASSGPMEFVKEEIVPSRSFTSGLAGIHRPDSAIAPGRPVIQTPNRYGSAQSHAEETKIEYSNSDSSSRKKSKMFSCTMYLPTGESDCTQLELKRSTTATQAIIATLEWYLRTHPRPDPTMLAKPQAYRIYMADDDGELDDSFPPLDPGCVLATTGVDVFLMQKKVPVSSSMSVIAGVNDGPVDGPNGGGSTRQNQHRPTSSFSSLPSPASLPDHLQRSSSSLSVFDDDSMPLSDPDTDMLHWQQVPKRGTHGHHMRLASEAIAMEQERQRAASRASVLAGDLEDVDQEYGHTPYHVRRESSSGGATSGAGDGGSNGSGSKRRSGLPSFLTSCFACMFNRGGSNRRGNRNRNRRSSRRTSSNVPSTNVSPTHHHR